MIDEHGNEISINILSYLNHRTGSVVLETPPETLVQTTDDVEEHGNEMCIK